MIRKNSELGDMQDLEAALLSNGSGSKLDSIRFHEEPKGGGSCGCVPPSRQYVLDLLRIFYENSFLDNRLKRLLFNTERTHLRERYSEYTGRGGCKKAKIRTIGNILNLTELAYIASLLYKSSPQNNPHRVVDIGGFCGTGAALLKYLDISDVLMVEPNDRSIKKAKKLAKSVGDRYQYDIYEGTFQQALQRGVIIPTDAFFVRYLYDHSGGEGNDVLESAVIDQCVEHQRPFLVMKLCQWVSSRKRLLRMQDYSKRLKTSGYDVYLGCIGGNNYDHVLVASNQKLIQD